MGCDIHFYVEKRDTTVGGGVGPWYSPEQWQRPKWADDDEPQLDDVEYDESYCTGRNYDLFAILANVRNGSGFAGCDLGSEKARIAEPRGLPDDVCDQIRAQYDQWDCDAHSASHFTLFELLSFAWTQTSQKRGYTTLAEFCRWYGFRLDLRQEDPKEYCGMISGQKIQLMTTEEATDLIHAKCPEDIKLPWDRLKWAKENYPDIHVHVEWSQSYHRQCDTFWSETIPRLLRLGPSKDVRIVFWFDN